MKFLLLNCTAATLMCFYFVHFLSKDVTINNPTKFSILHRWKVKHGVCYIILLYLMFHSHLSVGL